MKKKARHIGLILITIGTIGLSLTRLHCLTGHNSLLLCSFIAITLGIILHIRSIMHDSRF